MNCWQSAAVYGGVFLQTLTLAWFLTPLARRIGMRWGMMDEPGDRKIHREVIPRSGGLAIFTAFVGAIGLDVLLAAWLIEGAPDGDGLAPYRANLSLVAPRLIAILSGLTLVFLIGVMDDRKGLGPKTKLAGQILSVAPLLWAGVRIDAYMQEWMTPGVATAIGAALTIGWVVLLTNSFNFLDNMDGLTGGIALVISLTLAAYSMLSGHVFMSAAYLALAGAALGFLRYNWHPARLFMGDSGSMTFGYALAALSVNSRFAGPETQTGLPVLIPLLVMSVPIFDTATVLLIRLRRGAPLMKGDMNHLSHRLVFLGFTRPQAVTFICLLTLVSALMALPLKYLPLHPALLHILAIAALFVLIFIMERVAQRKIIRAEKEKSFPLSERNQS